MKSRNKGLMKGIKLEWWQIGLYKLAIASFGILLGIYFFQFLSQYVTIFWFLFIVPGIYIASVWLKQ